MNIQRKTLVVAALLLPVLPGACVSSPRRYKEASLDMTDQLIAQLEKRTDPRHVRVLVYEFTPCETPTQGYLRARGGHSDVHFAARIKHQIMSALARKVVVIEGESGNRLLHPIDGEPEEPHAEAKRLGATAVLVGNYSVTGSQDILLMARLVDTESNQILATADQTLEGVDVPRAHR